MTKTKTDLAVVLDLDGTLVDSVYPHVVAWMGAFGDVGLTVPSHQIHQLIGMGGDRLVAAATSDAVEQAVGDRVRERHQDRFTDLLPLVAPAAGAADLVEQLARLGAPVTLATSGGPDVSEPLLDLVPGIRALLDDGANSDDAPRSKPAGDLIEESLRTIDADRVIAIGDTIWDVRAAADAGAGCIGLLTGGVSRSELLDAGALRVYETAGQLAYHLSRGHPIDDPGDHLG